MFGCGEGLAPGALGVGREVAEAAFGLRADRLLHSDDFDLGALEVARRMSSAARAWVLGGVGVFGLLGPLVFVHLRMPGFSGSGRVHTLPSTPETVRLGVFDTTLS